MAACFERVAVRGVDGSSVTVTSQLSVQRKGIVVTAPRQADWHPSRLSQAGPHLSLRSFLGEGQPLPRDSCVFQTQLLGARL